MPYELTEIHVLADGRRMPVTVDGPWPMVEPDGRFTVPYQLVPDYPLRLNCPAPPTCSIDVSLVVAGPHVPGHRRTTTLE
jgi:hypothetical protein